METVTVELTDNEEATIERVIKRRGMEESTSWYLRHAALELPLAERRAARLEEENRALGERVAALQRDVAILRRARALDAQRREAADRAYDAYDDAAARSTREQIERGGGGQPYN